ncbi:hypothetical protein PCASD_06481 [Puccinia coronata f. sp. avenae]|uniref:Uncharacterized protein n=1 Tax=Puccinia coronata f. sp. avenae TaxID=200324 RepID=A0A2N5V1W5_9BASI|nr:hypothetical protein PCASD_06481 [Puccinia coronata f. sp. avenae]
MVPSISSKSSESNKSYDPSNQPDLSPSSKRECSKRECSKRECSKRECSKRK